MASKWAIEKAAQCWCKPETEHVEMSTALATVFAELLEETRDKPRLGYATTAELIEEVRARIELDGMLGYSTVRGEDYERENCSIKADRRNDGAGNG